MKVLAHSRGGVAIDKGTPLRFRHLLQALNDREGVTIQLVSRDDPQAVETLLPGVVHFSTPLGDEAAVLRNQFLSFKPDIVYGQTDKSAGDMFKLHEIKGKAKLVVDLHGDLIAERLSDESRSTVGRWIAALRSHRNQHRIFPRMDAFTTVGQILADKMASYGKPIEVLWGGVNTKIFKVVESTPSNVVQVAYAGNYRPYQGITTLLEAAALLVRNNEPFHFTLIGDIDAFPVMKELAVRELGSHVTLTGRVPYEQVPEIIGKADVLVVPRAPNNAANYNYPSKLSEYLSLGKPVIAHGVGEVSRVLKNGQNGLVVEPEDPKALSAGLLSLKDGALRKRLGENGRAFAETHLSWPVIGQKLYSFLSNL